MDKKLRQYSQWTFFQLLETKTESLKAASQSSCSKFPAEDLKGETTAFGDVGQSLTAKDIDPSIKTALLLSPLKMEWGLCEQLMLKISLIKAGKLQFNHMITG